MEKFFHLKENGTTVSTEILAGLTTFFAMAYIIVVNPQILSQTGMPWGGVFLATIIAAIIGTLVMGLFANVPYAQAAGMGLNAFFTYTVCFGLGFSWQQTMCMVFLCGLINILITVTKIRKMIIAYEPIWAIGTGKTATADQAEEVCGQIRKVIGEVYGEAVAEATTVQYGGSMNAKNCEELLSKKDVDGGLIGGASLKAADFTTIINAAVNG